MKKWQLYTSIGLNGLLSVSLIILLIPNELELVDLSMHTQQNLSKSSKIKSGMDSEKVIKIMGVPIVREFDELLDEWHYCKTGYNIDEYVV